jgi:hypothetical protein
MFCPYCKKDTVSMNYNLEFITGIENEETIPQCEECLGYWSVADYNSILKSLDL